MPAAQIYEYGFAMILYPTTVLFRLVKATERALAALHAGRPLAEGDAVTLEEFEDVVGLPAWSEIEKRFGQG